MASIVCERAYAILYGITQGRLSASEQELAELDQNGLVVGADVQALRRAPELHNLCLKYGATMGPGGPTQETFLTLVSSLQKLETDLKSDWHRSFTSALNLANEDNERVQLRKLISILMSPATAETFGRAQALLSALPKGAQPISGAGSNEVWTITRRGQMVLPELYLRYQRYAGQPLGKFLSAYDKVSQKMAQFVRDVAMIDKGIGYVPKMKEQVVIGLMKTGMDPQRAVATYQSSLQGAGYQSHDPKGKQRPHRAVAAVRNAQFGNLDAFESQVRQAYRALCQAGFPPSLELEGAAKSLLLVQPLQHAVARFSNLYRALWRQQRAGADGYKLVARLMMATGEPEVVVQRVLLASRQLASTAGSPMQHQQGVNPVAVAVAAMVNSDAELSTFVPRFIEIERQLMQTTSVSAAMAESLALDCCACPGSPHEVVRTVSELSSQLKAAGVSAHLVIAAAFAKRFAY